MPLSQPDASNKTGYQGWRGSNLIRMIKRFKTEANDDTNTEGKKLNYKNICRNLESAHRSKKPKKIYYEQEITIFNMKIIYNNKITYRSYYMFATVTAGAGPGR